VSGPASSQPSRRRKASGQEEEALGRRLRSHREAVGLSLRELARRLGISASAVSQIETGKSRPSVSTLYAIVTELGVSLDELFSGTVGDAGARPPAPPPLAPPQEAAGPAEQIDDRRVQRAGTRHTIEFESGVRWERLTAAADPDADFLYVIYDRDGSSSDGDRFIRHSGREYGLVLSGSLEVTVGFETSVLSAGDSISFDSTVPHRLRNVGTEPVRGVWFVIGRESDGRAFGFQPSDGADRDRR
jgi:transcriptional regulator with XRE-family HTH domain